jgi:Cu/Ag efflux protein CusF
MIPIDFEEHIMHSKASCVAVALATLFAVGASAQTREGYVASEPGRAAVAQTTRIAATIVAIDATSREVTLKGAGGREVTLVAGPEVRNFAQLKAGDDVDIQYVEAVLLELHKGGGLPVARTEEGAKARAQPGETPGAAVGRQITVVGDVVATDATTQRVTLRGPQRTIDVTVRDPEQFRRIATGDQIEATYIEGVAIDVQPK